MKLVYGNPQLEAMVASAFAAPLVQLACDNSLVLSIYSHQSGVGKIDGDEAGTGSVGSPTHWHVDARRHAQLRHGEDHRRFKQPAHLLGRAQDRGAVGQAGQLVFTTTQGRSKAGLTRDSSPATVKMSTTMFAVASNHGILDARSSAPRRAPRLAGLRVFEMQAGPLTKRLTRTITASTDASRSAELRRRRCALC